MKYYLIGIKGSGMSALAGILHDLGNTVVGYDDSMEYKFTIEGLNKRGIKIYHDSSFIPTSDFIVCYSNAVSQEHKEIKRLKELNLKQIRYQDLLGSLTKIYETISISGTHGKTTTSLMVSSILDAVYGANYFVGDGRGHGNIDNKLFVLESCEYNKHFLSYYPKTLVITNIDLEHTECYKDIDDIIYNFNILASQTSDNLVLCGDDENVRKIKSDKNKYYYGFNDNNDLVARDLKLNESGSEFSVYYKGEYFDTFKLNLYGRHMVLDSLACIMVSILYNVDKKNIKEKLSEFLGATRRFNETKINNSIIIDDYAHHPTEIMATLDSSRQKYKDKKIVAVFLPNTYSRTKDFMDDFANVLGQFDASFIMDIKCDRERPEDYPGVTSDTLISKAKNADKISIETARKLLDYKDDVICFMSCANINPMIEAYKKELMK
ncbi:MAG: UDP-N-acetylmuramate--L-alanine ligase [Bacilli bacterium]|nr:UDP-N-acetylmuramate--L-alanine ligase [Bacilli bacterium]